MDYESAMSYAKTSNTEKYVEAKYQEAQRELKKYERKLRSESCHFLLGAQGSFYVDGGFEAEYAGIVASIGGHSNRFNFEIGANYDLAGGYCFNFRPRVNIVKKKYTGDVQDTYKSGSKYSRFYLYAEPEFTLWPSSFYDYGVRAGLGIGLWEVSAAYMIQEQAFTVGIAFYLGYK